MSLFPTEAEQIQSLEEADEREVSASFLMEKATDVMLRFGGNISRTANFVGMERSALHRKLKFLGVQAEDRQGQAGAAAGA